jgi:hypothetical protein
LSTSLHQFADSAVAATPRADPVDALADLRRGVGGGRRQPDTPEHRQIQQVVAHISDLVFGQALAGEDLAQRLELVARALADDRNSQLRGPLGRRRRLSRRQQARRQAGALGEDNGRAVADVELLRLRAIGVEQDLAVREDAIHVEQQQPHAARPLGQVGGHGQMSSVPHRSCRCTTPSTSPLRKPRRSR